MYFVGYHSLSCIGRHFAVESPNGYPYTKFGAHFGNVGWNDHPVRLTQFYAARQGRVWGTRGQQPMADMLGMDPDRIAHLR